MSELFPELAGIDLHIIGESYGGIQAISLAYALLNPDVDGPTPHLAVRSVIPSSTLVEVGLWAPGYYDTLCGRETKYLNHSQCAVMAASVPGCEKASVQCRMSDSYNDCFAMVKACSALVQYWYPPERNIVKRE